MSDEELMQRVGLRSELDSKTVAVFRAAGDYFALLGEDPFRGPGRLPLNINEREELESRMFGGVAYSSRLGSNSRPSPSLSLKTPQQQQQPGRGTGRPPFSRGSGSYDVDGRNVRGWDEGHGRSLRQEEQQFRASSYRNRDRSRSRDRSRVQGRSRSRERMYPDQSYERS